MQQYYLGHFGAGNVEISIVGDFDPESIKKVLADTFGNWPNPTPYSPGPAALQIGASATQEAINTPDQEVAWVMLGTTFELADTDPDYPRVGPGGAYPG